MKFVEKWSRDWHCEVCILAEISESALTSSRLQAEFGGRILRFYNDFSSAHKAARAENAVKTVKRAIFVAAQQAKTKGTKLWLKEKCLDIQRSLNNRVLGRGSSGQIWKAYMIHHENCDDFLRDILGQRELARRKSEWVLYMYTVLVALPVRFQMRHGKRYIAHVRWFDNLLQPLPKSSLLIIKCTMTSSNIVLALGFWLKLGGVTWEVIWHVDSIGLGYSSLRIASCALQNLINVCD